MTWAEVRTARYRWEQQGVLHMGEHPPLLTPQGPGVPRARRPRFPRVEDSRTSGVPSSFSDSLGIASPFAASASRPGSHHFFPRFDTGSSTGLPALVALVFPSASFPFLPLPCVQFSPVLSTLVRFVLPPSSRPLGVPTLPPFSFRIPGSAAPLSGLGFCGPRVAPKRPHTTPQERQEQQGRFGHLNLTLSSRRSPAVHWKPRSESVSF